MYNSVTADTIRIINNGWNINVGVILLYFVYHVTLFVKYRNTSVVLRPFISITWPQTGLPIKHFYSVCSADVDKIQFDAYL